MLQGKQEPTLLKATETSSGKTSLLCYRTLTPLGLPAQFTQKASVHLVVWSEPPEGAAALRL